MKSPLLSFAFLWVLLPLQAQIQKNTWLIDGGMTYQLTTLPGSNLSSQHFTLEPEFLFFPSSKFGFGGDFTFNGARTNDIFGNQSLNFSFFNVEMAPKIRYLIYEWSEGETALFLQADTRFGLTSSVVNFETSDRESFLRWGWSLGLGLTHFLSPAMAIEWQFAYQKTTFFDNEQTLNDEGQKESGVVSSIGLRFYLLDSDSQGESLESNRFNRGNWMIGGSGHFNYSENNGFNIGLSPRVGRFLTDKLVLGGGPDMSFFEVAEADGFSWGLESFIRYYQPLSNTWQFFPAISFRYGRIKNNPDFSPSTGQRFRTTRFKAGAGFNTMVRPSVGLEILLSYQKDNIKQVSPDGLPAGPQDNLLVEFGIQFFLKNN